MKPQHKPRNARFSSGPCPKRPGWAFSSLNADVLGRSHRSLPGKARLKRAIDETRDILELPDDYLIGIVPASDTGAVETALWSLLGPRPVDVLAWESFGKTWWTDISTELNLSDARLIAADYGQLPDLSQVDPAHDIVFPWNGTTSGVTVPNADFIAENREGLTICDATSAIFATSLPWNKLDVVTYSWQKALGGEAAHGMLILSPRAVARLEDYDPPWPMPKIFRLKKGGKVNKSIFEGSTINTPSMMVVEDYLDALAWARSVGGGPGLIERTRINAAAIEAWVARTDWIDYLAEDKSYRSSTSVCLKFSHPQVKDLAIGDQGKFVKAMVRLLEREGAAFDIGSYRDAPPGLRIWAGATVEVENLEALFPWLEWAFAETLSGSEV